MVNSGTTKRSKRSLPSISASLDETNYENENLSKAKSKRRKNPKHEHRQISSFEQDSELTRNIEYLRDDIVNIGYISPQKCSREESKLHQETNKVFIELPGGFKEVKKNEIENVVDVCELYFLKNYKLKSDLSIFVQRISHRIAGLAHGLIAGISFWECVMSYFLHPPNFSHHDFSVHFSAVANVSQIIFFTLLITCLIDVLDRGDVIRTNSTYLQHFFSIGSASVLIIFYSVSLILTLYISSVEMKYSDYLSPNVTNLTEWQLTVEDHDIWWSITATRAIVLCISWIILTLWPPDTRFLSHLEEIKERELSKKYTQSIL